MVAAMRVKSPFSQSALFGFMGSIYDGQADRAIYEFCYENIELPVPVPLSHSSFDQFIYLSLRAPVPASTFTIAGDPDSQV
jgi:hypothetical protein